MNSWNAGFNHIFTFEDIHAASNVIFIPARFLNLGISNITTNAASHLKVCIQHRTLYDATFKELTFSFIAG